MAGCGCCQTISAKARAWTGVRPACCLIVFILSFWCCRECQSFCCAIGELLASRRSTSKYSSCRSGVACVVACYFLWRCHCISIVWWIIYSHSTVNRFLASLDGSRGKEEQVYKAKNLSCEYLQLVNPELYWKKVVWSNLTIEVKRIFVPLAHMRSWSKANAAFSQLS